MDYKTIEDVYSANSGIRQALKDAIGELTDEQINAKADPEQWSIREVVEHVALVGEGMSKICAKLLSKAEAAGKGSDGSLCISPEFMASLGAIRDEKVKAPDIALPVHSLSIAASLERLDSGEALFEELRPKFEAFDGAEAKFPHPLFGGLSAHEWLFLSGAHEARHISQVRRLAASLTGP